VDQLVLTVDRPLDLGVARRRIKPRRGGLALSRGGEQSVEVQFDRSRFECSQQFATVAPSLCRRRDPHPVEFGRAGDCPLVVVARLGGQQAAHRHQRPVEGLWAVPAGLDRVQTVRDADQEVAATVEIALPDPSEVVATRNIVGIGARRPHRPLVEVPDRIGVASVVPSEGHIAGHRVVRSSAASGFRLQVGRVDNAHKPLSGVRSHFRRPAQAGVMTETNRVFLLAERPDGRPDEDTFELTEREVPGPGPGEALVRTLYLSVDPYMRGRMAAGESYAEAWGVGEPLQAGVVGEVVESNGAGFEPGDVVTGNLQWADYATAPGTELHAVDPDLAPISTALGVLGMPGRTAYFGTKEVAQPTAGDTFVVSGAAGAVGSVAGQIASLQGARVVGFAGSDEKVAFLEDELGFDAGINYETTDDYRAALAEVAPDGVDAYFDNVGGPITDAVFSQLNVDARVAVCGQISQYNATERPTGPRKLGKLIETRATVEGFLVGDFQPRATAATRQLGEWVSTGEVEYRETVTEGLENAPDAFLGLFDGDNIGKQLVHVADRSD